MEANNTFTIPHFIDTEIKTEVKDKSSAYFDFVKGDFAQNLSGKIIKATPYDTWVQWCLKTVNTQRWAFLSYNDDIGVEIEEAFKENSKAAIESEIMRTIDEALIADTLGRTIYVKDFRFKWGVDDIHVTFTVKGIWSNDATLTVSYKK